MKTKVLSVRLKSLVSISDKAYKAETFNGASAILPKSQVFGKDYEVINSDAFWIAAWILEKSTLQYSQKKVRWFNTKTGLIEPEYKYEIHHHIPQKKEAKKPKIIRDLKR